ncbi:MAG: phosphoribosylformylglycinamidine cyclo-ligase [Verrucomicrobia bacterium]|nr:phosphoribosylformylglycinamidine cyclo-ligase [Verrucomicrobiota bacterium]
MSQTKAYAQAGVDIALADQLLNEIKPALKLAVRPESLGAIGGFGGLFDMTKVKTSQPVLVSSTDSVGTKVKVATMTGEYRWLGADIVNHCSNDIAVCGAEPLFFLDYFATAKLTRECYVPLLKGLANACRKGNVALVGGETAELPGVYANEEFDLVGTIVGVVSKPKILDKRAVRKGDVLIGLGSSGLHTNGYSLARKILFQDLGLQVNSPLPGSRSTVGAALMQPHINYAPFLLDAYGKLNTARNSSQRKGNNIFAVAHITGGGITGNLPRVLPPELDAHVDTKSWKRPAIFNFFASQNSVSLRNCTRCSIWGSG